MFQHKRPKEPKNGRFQSSSLALFQSFSLSFSSIFAVITTIISTRIIIVL